MSPPVPPHSSARSSSGAETSADISTDTSTETETGVIKVLLVEDDSRLSDLTAEYLTSHGLRVTQVATGPDGVKAALERQYDVILLDLNLPGMDGVEVCRQLRQRQATPIIMVTARDEMPDRVVGLDAGADDYLGKPFAARELLSRIHAAVRRNRGAVGPQQKKLSRAACAWRRTPCAPTWTTGRLI